MIFCVIIMNGVYGNMNFLIGNFVYFIKQI